MLRGDITSEGKVLLSLLPPFNDLKQQLCYTVVIERGLVGISGSA